MARLAAAIRRPPDTVQLKALSRKILNVVGEDHDESNLPERRAIETKIAKAEADGDYWNEGDFEARDLGFWESIFSKDQRATADPIVLRGNYASVTAASGADRLLRYAAKNPVDIDEGVSIKPALMEALKGSCNSVLAGMSLLMQFATIGEKSEEWKRMSGKETQALHALIDFSTGTWDAVLALARRLNGYTALAEIHADLVKEAKVLTLVKSTMELHGAILLQGALGKWSEKFNAEDSRQKLTGTGPARFLRSMEMGSVGDTRSKTKGIWKVGSGHIEDLASHPGKYTMLTRKEFNDEYAAKYKLPLKPG